MKRKARELDVDFIGEQDRPLTKEEQLSISAFIQKLKEERKTQKRKKLPKKEQPV